VHLVLQDYDARVLRAVNDEPARGVKLCLERPGAAARGRAEGPRRCCEQTPQRSLQLRPGVATGARSRRRPGARPIASGLHCQAHAYQPCALVHWCLRIAVASGACRTAPLLSSCTYRPKNRRLDGGTRDARGQQRRPVGGSTRRSLHWQQLLCQFIQAVAFCVREAALSSGVLAPPVAGAPRNMSSSRWNVYPKKSELCRTP
jgi:hypothetical protein